MAEAAVKRTFKKTANVTLELLKIVANVEYYVRFIGPMHIGKAVAGPVKVDPNTGEVKPGKEPAMIAFIDDLETDKERIIICSTVLRKELADAYPNDSYISKTFGFKQTKIEGKSYNLVELWEVEDPNPARSAEVLEAHNIRAAKAAAAAAAEPAKTAETITAGDVGNAAALVPAAKSKK